MKDPLAPENAYDQFRISMDAGTGEIEEAFDDFAARNPEWAVEATEIYDELRQPESRMMIDIFQYYDVGDEKTPEKCFDFELPAIQDKDLSRVEQELTRKIRERGKEIDFGPDKPIMDLGL